MRGKHRRILQIRPNLVAAGVANAARGTMVATIQISICKDGAFRRKRGFH
jgi:hypothetical protein